MDKWERLKQSIQEMHDNNQDKSEIKQILHFLLNLMSAMETREGQ